MMLLTPVEVRRHPIHGDCVLDTGYCVPRLCPVGMIGRVLASTHALTTPTAMLGDMPSTPYSEFVKLPFVRYIIA